MNCRFSDRMYVIKLTL